MTALCRRVGFYRGDLIPHITGNVGGDQDCAVCYRAITKQQRGPR